MIEKFIFYSLSFFLLFIPQEIAAQKFDCKSSIQKISMADKSQWALDQSVFSSSVDTTIFWGGTWLSGTQAMKSLALQNPFLSPSFAITLPMDVGLTLASHFFALESFSAIHHLSKKQEFWVRAGFNTALGSLIIPGFWALFNGLHSLGLSDTTYNISPITCLGAVGLCAVVYPSLQKSKNFLFKERPLAQDQKNFKWLKKRFQNELSGILESISKREKDLDLSESEVSRVALISNIIGSQPLEVGLNQIDKFFSELQKEQALHSHEKRIRKIMGKLQASNDEMKTEVSGLKKWYLSVLKKDRIKIIEQRKIHLRHQLIQELLALETRGFMSEEIQKLLWIDEAFTPQQSLLFHRDLQNMIKSRRFHTVIHSFLDQALAVGVAGGLFLYGVNQWAATGETPWFIEWILKGGIF